MSNLSLGDKEKYDNLITVNWLNTMKFTEGGDTVHHAEIIGITPEELKQYVKEVHGKTFMKWRTDLRLELSMRLILQYNFTSAEVARLCGFASPAHFRNLYIDRYGISPSQQYTYILHCNCSKDYKMTGLKGILNNVAAKVLNDRPQKGEDKSSFIIEKRHETSYLTTKVYPNIDIPYLREGYFMSENTD